MRRPALAALAAVLALPALAQDELRPPVQTRSPNAPDQTPAFERQTRAPQPAQEVDVESEVVARGLPRLWAMEFLPDGRMLVTAKRGTMHVVTQDGTFGEPISGVPEVEAREHGGLLDVALAPDFADSGTVYFSFAEPREGGSGTSLARARLVLDANSGALEDVEVIFRQTPAYRGNLHYGSRIAFRPDGTLFLAVGERFDTPIRDRAQDLSTGMGKVFRLNPDGSAPDDNPFVDHADAQPEIWSYGHRNVQSATVTEDGTLWTVEHGPLGGDELNRPEPGLNYGWPVITYGINYNGQPIGEGITEKEGMEQPVYYWDPVIAPSGMDEYRGDEFPEWQGDLLVGGLASQTIVVLDMEDGRVASESRVPMAVRVRDVKVGPDGAVYAITEGQGSAIVRLTNGGSA